MDKEDRHKAVKLAATASQLEDMRDRPSELDMMVQLCHPRIQKDEAGECSNEFQPGPLNEPA